MNYHEISKDTISYLYKSYNSLKGSPLDSTIRVLVELRTSQINGCHYCCSLHSNEAKTLGIHQEKINALATWNKTNLFTKEEMAALQWTEELTKLKINTNKSRTLLRQYFSERQLVDLTTCISIMNALNRIAISLKD